MNQIDPKQILNKLAPPSVKYFWRVNYDMSFDIWSRDMMLTEISYALEREESYRIHEEFTLEFKQSRTFYGAKKEIGEILKYRVMFARLMISNLRSMKCPK